MTTSTLFLNYVTCIDYAVIDSNTGRVTGGSFSPIIEVTGIVEDIEQVVIDFSTVKRYLKDLIDNKKTGYDHKLWYIRGFSNAVILEDNEGVMLTSVASQIKIPKNALRIFDTQWDPSKMFSNNVETELSEYLTKNLSSLFPDTQIHISVKLQDTPIIPLENGWMFKYSHGLKNSSSWGCQNIAHGHLSFIDFEFYNPTKAQLYTHGPSLFSIMYEMDCGVFIWRDNVIQETDDNISISYTTKRGTFSACYNKHKNNVIVLDTETTIENIADWFCKKHKHTLISAGISRVFISEGLSKGAVITL